MWLFVPHKLALVPVPQRMAWVGLAVQFFTGDRQDLYVPWEARRQV